MFCSSFSDKVIEHFMCPGNIGVMRDAQGEGTAGDPACGDSLTVYIKVKENIITEISFMVFGCVAAIATSSMTSELVKGRTLEEALMLTDTEIAEALDGLPENKMHCSVLGAAAVKNAVENYYSRQAALTAMPPETGCG